MRKLAIGFMAALVATGAAAAQCQYEVTKTFEVDLEPGQTMSVVAINDHGDACGNIALSIYDQPFVWYDGGELTLLEKPPGFVRGTTSAINSDGTVCGTLFLSDAQGGLPRPVVWIDGEANLLPLPEGANEGFANGLNDAGVVVGYVNNSAFGPTNAVIWSDRLTTLNSILNVTHSRAYDIGPQNQVVGGGGSHPLTDWQAFLLEGEVVTLLGLVPPDGVITEGRSVNGLNRVAGFATYPNPDPPPTYQGGRFEWHNGVIAALLSATGQQPDTTVANAVTDAGLIVGSYSGPGDEEGDGYWDNGTFYDFNDLLVPTEDLVIFAVGGASPSGSVLVRGYPQGGSPSSDSIIVLSPVGSMAADLDATCQVDVGDLLILLGEWGAGDSIADLTDDGQVGTADLLELLAQWG